LQSLHEFDSLGLLNKLLHWPVAVNVVLNVVSERLELVLGRLEVQDGVVLLEPLLLLVEVVLANLRWQRKTLRLILQV
jgi:hypothetical protein